MTLSVVICTRNRAEQLTRCLAKLAQIEPERNDIELVVVDNASTDDTARVIAHFAHTAPFKVQPCFEGKPGLSHARNCGVAHASGDLIFFTDDDCYLEAGFFSKLEQAVATCGFEYGGGQILPHGDNLDPGVAKLPVRTLRMVPAGTSVVPTGAIQGASMFFKRKVLETIGLFNVRMGAGTPFPCEDIELVARASRAGFTGGQVPGFTVYHDHGRKQGSDSAKATLHGYTRGRGAYYAELLLSGVERVWPHWWQRSYVNAPGSVHHKLRQLSVEMASAAEYLAVSLQHVPSNVAPKSRLALKIHAVVISWPAVHDNARKIAEQLASHVDGLTVIYSTRDGSSLSGAGDWKQVPDDWYFGKKFSEALQVCRGDVLLLLHADAFHDDWRHVLDVCRQRFENSTELGVWAPICDETHWPVDQVALMQLEESACYCVSQTDCIVSAFSAPVIERLKALDYTNNNLGWGIDWAAIAYAYSHHLLVVQDTSVQVRHAAGTGYAKHEAGRQMDAFLQQLTIQEQAMYRLLNPQAILRPVVPPATSLHGHAQSSARVSHAADAMQHVSMQLEQLQSHAHSPWKRQVPAGYMRGMDFYEPDSLRRVMTQAARVFHHTHGVLPDLVNPTRFVEKIFWHKFFGEMKVPESGNKLATSAFIPSHLRERIACPEVVWHSHQPLLPANHEVPPGIYYLKASHGSGMFNRVVYPMSAQDRLALEAQTAQWLKTPFGLYDGEWWYNTFKPAILLEKSVCSEADAISWNIPVINGHTPVLALYRKPVEGEHGSAWFDAQLNPLPQPASRPRLTHIEFPDAIADMFDHAREIAKPFRFVRVDFLQGSAGKPYLCELTFSPGNALTRFHPDVDQLLSSYWQDLQ